MTDKKAPTKAARLRPTSARLVRRSSGEYVADHLRRWIFEGRIRPGSRILQEEIAKELGVSRIPVREALVALEKEGRVRMEMHRGARVLPMDETSVRDNHELTGLIYAFVVRRAAERVTPELLVKLTQIAKTLEGTVDAKVMFEENEAFYDTIMEGGAAPRMAYALRDMRALVVNNFFEVIPGALEINRDGILAIINAIREGDGDRAVAEVSRLQDRSCECVILAFRERGMFVEYPESQTATDS
jgi:DNA-binding GntR family transcriptional regulator